MDGILFIGYCLKYAKSTLSKKTKQEERNVIAPREKDIREKLRDLLGIVLDEVVRVCCKGTNTSNTGNVARKFFENSNVVSKITKVHEILIKRFHIIMIALSSDYCIHVDGFDTYATDQLCFLAVSVKYYPREKKKCELKIKQSFI